MILDYWGLGGEEMLSILYGMSSRGEVIREEIQGKGKKNRRKGGKTEKNKRKGRKRGRYWWAEKGNERNEAKKDDFV